MYDLYDLFYTYFVNFDLFSFAVGFCVSFFITKIKVILWTLRKLKNQIKYLFRF